MEVELWEAVLLDPERLERGLNAYLEAEKEARVFTNRIAEVDRKGAAYQDMVADGLMEKEELRTKLDALSRQKGGTKVDGGASAQDPRAPAIAREDPRPLP
jgi:hypothetical protein